MEDLYRMEGRATRAILDLVAAARAWRRDEHVVGRTADGRKEDEFADLHRQLEVLPLVELGRHAAVRVAGAGVVGRAGGENLVLHLAVDGEHAGAFH